MGMYMYVTEDDIKRMKRVDSDKDINELLKEALEYNGSLLIEESYNYREKKGYRGWLLGEKEKYFRYQVYFESPAHDGSPYQAQYVTTCNQSKTSVITYLFGIINGGLGVLKQQEK